MLEEPRPVSVAKEIQLAEKTTTMELLKEYKDVFAWSYEDMKGLDPQFYQHQMHLSKDAKPVAQRCYQMNLNYTARVIKEIDKLLRVTFIQLVNHQSW
mgnify:FL=1